eukprot:TRINITY_DN8988_c0_g1_i1.p1 TRINITY_DN8988_c0_g1~~TRINITY_DN8988_c0_g1_i1.p1  ORF type:complete len:235 (-),score=64.05 TRINITY_DN8988_c0_g1_i1:145-849(-)
MSEEATADRLGALEATVAKLTESVDLLKTENAELRADLAELRQYVAKRLPEEGDAQQPEQPDSGPSEPELRALLFGLDEAGKTQLLYRLKLGELVQTIPTIGFNVENLSHKGVQVTIWDVGGQEKVRPLWRHYTATSRAVVFVVDAADPARLPTVKEVLQSQVFESDNLARVPLLVYANKQDLPGALSADEVAARLALHKTAEGRKWHVQGCSVKGNSGLQEGLDWLVGAVDPL